MIEFNILNIGAFYKAQSKPPPLHSHEEWQWDFLTSGKIRMVFKHEAVILLPGDSLLTPPWLPHTLHWLNNCVINSFHFKWPEAPPISRDAGILIKGGNLRLSCWNIFSTMRHFLMRRLRQTPPAVCTCC